MTARQKTACCSAPSPRPNAWATKPVVPERRKFSVEKTMSKMIAPMARPPISAASPNWPITAVSTMPRIGVVRKAKVIGAAMEKTMRLVTSKGRDAGLAAAVMISSADDSGGRTREA